MARLLTFPNVPTAGHMSAVARKRIIIIQAKYLMFPLSERVYQQMRQLPFIVRTKTRRPFPTAGPDLATGPSAGGEPAGGPDHRGARTTAAESHDHVASIQRPHVLERVDWDLQV